MKKFNVFYLFIALAAIVLLGSCTKTEIEVKNSDNSVDKFRDAFTNKDVEKIYNLQSCVVELDELPGELLFGVFCSRGTYSQCPSESDCTPLTLDGDYIVLGISSNSLKEYGFTEAQIENWIRGVNVFEYNVEFVTERYDFYLILHELGLSYHPDYLIEILLQN